MLDTLITSKTRVKILLKFFMNPSIKGYLRELAKEMQESTNSVRVELDKLVEAGYLKKEKEKNKIFYRANVQHKLFPEIHSLVKKYLGIDILIENVIMNLGDLKEGFVIGDYAKGIDSGVIDIVLVGKIDEVYLFQLIKKAENILNRKIRFLILTPEEKEQYKKILNVKQGVLIWKEPN